eukprot:400010-Rhodomonas_salina.2
MSSTNKAGQKERFLNRYSSIQFVPAQGPGYIYWQVRAMARESSAPDLMRSGAHGGVQADAVMTDRGLLSLLPSFGSFLAC